MFALDAKTMQKIAPVVRRVVIVDPNPAAARLMSKLMLVMGAAPILAPSLGGLLLGVGGWRSIFWFSAS